MKILMVGAGGVGCEFLIQLTEYLKFEECEEWMDELVLVDADVVEESNLHRQRLFSVEDIGRFKVQVAAEKFGLGAIGIASKVEDLNDLNFFGQFDCFILAVDSLETRRWLNSTVFQAKRSHHSMWFLLDFGVQGFKCSIRSYVGGGEKSDASRLACLECSIGLFGGEDEVVPVCSVYGHPRDLKDCVFWSLNAAEEGEVNSGLDVIFARAFERAESFSIDTSDLSYKYIQDLMTKAVPAVASVNSVLSVEGLRLFLELKQVILGEREWTGQENNFWMINLEEGYYEMGTRLEALPDCIICSQSI